MGALVDRKNKAYGDSFHRSGEIIHILYPHGIRPDQYGDMLAMIRVIDKMFRIANRKAAFGENPWMDIAGYGILKCRDIELGDQDQEENPYLQAEREQLDKSNEWRNGGYK